MRKGIVVSLLLGLMVSSGIALQSGVLPEGVGAKYSAMGGAGSAIVDDISCSYFNPAGIVSAGAMELKLGAATATEGMNDLTKALTGLSDPAKFLADNFNNTVNVKGGINAFLGLNLAKIGISVLPVANLTLSKPTAGTVAGTLAGSGYGEGILTLGYSFSIPGLPVAGLDVGINVKAIQDVTASSTAVGTTSADSVLNYTGMGYDVGVKASINTLAVPLSVGVVMKDIGATLKGKQQAITTTYNPLTGAITGQTKTETTLADQTYPTTLVIGAATQIPGVGLKVAADYDSVSGSGVSYNVTHLGIEYPIAGLLSIRAGMISGNNGNISVTTVGAGFDILMGLNVAYITDSKNNKNNKTAVDFGFAF